LNEAIIPEWVGDCSGPAGTDPTAGLEAVSASMGVARMNGGDAFRAVLLGGLLELYYDILLDDFRDCPGMYLEV
jgi:hypothetical protein